MTVEFDEERARFKGRLESLCQGLGDGSRTPSEEVTLIVDFFGSERHERETRAKKEGWPETSETLETLEIVSLAKAARGGDKEVMGKELLPRILSNLVELAADDNMYSRAFMAERVYQKLTGLVVGLGFPAEDGRMWIKKQKDSGFRRWDEQPEEWKRWKREDKKLLKDQPELKRRGTRPIGIADG